MYITGVTVYYVSLNTMCHMWHDNNYIHLILLQEIRFKGLHHYLFITVSKIFSLL